MRTRPKNIFVHFVISWGCIDADVFGSISLAISDSITNAQGLLHFDATALSYISLLTAQPMRATIIL